MSQATQPVEHHPKPVPVQLEILNDLYPGLDGSHTEELATAWQILPKEAELLQVAPKLKAVARLEEISDPFGEGYGQCLERTIQLVADSPNFPNFVNHRKGKLTSQYVQLHQKTRKSIERLEAGFPGDFLVVPIQGGLLCPHHIGCSLGYSSPWEIKHWDWFPLPSWIVGHYLLTHPKLRPKRVHWGNTVWIDCSGDEYSPKGDSNFEYCEHWLCFFFDDHDRLHFSYHEWIRQD